MLPVRQLPREDFVFSDGITLSIRGLSRAEAIQIKALADDVETLEVSAIAASTGASIEEARAWIKATPSPDVAALVDAIARLSGLDPDSGKAVAGDLPSANGTESTTSLARTSGSP